VNLSYPFDTLQDLWPTGAMAAQGTLSQVPLLDWPDLSTQ
jgi:hypothetical protein